MFRFLICDLLIAASSTRPRVVNFAEKAVDHCCPEFAICKLLSATAQTVQHQASTPDLTEFTNGHCVWNFLKQ